MLQHMFSYFASHCPAGAQPANCFHSNSDKYLQPTDTTMVFSGKNFSSSF